MIKKFLFFFNLIFYISTSFAFAETSNSERVIKSLENIVNIDRFYKGDFSENMILDSDKMYVVMHNPQKFAFFVMQKGATEYCKESLQSENYVAVLRQLFGHYSAYFSCQANDIFYGYDISADEKACIKINDFNFLDKCDELNNKNSSIIDEIEELMKKEMKYTSSNFIYSVRLELSSVLDEYENRAFINERDEELKEWQQKNIQICEGYSFEIGTENFERCILALIENMADYLNRNAANENKDKGYYFYLDDQLKF